MPKRKMTKVALYHDDQYLMKLMSRTKIDRKKVSGTQKLFSKVFDIPDCECTEEEAYRAIQNVKAMVFGAN